MLSALLLLTLACGTERWDVKTLADKEAAGVNLDHPRSSSVGALRALEPPHASEDSPRAEAERQSFYVEVWLLGYKREKGDGDFHLVVADQPTGEGGTLIVELPDPECLASSRAADRLKAARETFLALVQDHPPAEKYRVLRRPLHLGITGVGFFDKLHGQTGVAPNGIELHPVLAVGRVR